MMMNVVTCRTTVTPTSTTLVVNCGILSAIAVRALRICPATSMPRPARSLSRCRRARVSPAWSPMPGSADARLRSCCTTGGQTRAAMSTTTATNAR